MRIGIYTDMHCSFTSSILPLTCKNSNYTYRLQMIIDTFKWMYDVFDKANVDFIVNCGDLFDSYRLRAEEVSAMAEALSYSKGLKEFHIIGNHELLDSQRHFYATALLSNYPNIEVIDQPTKLSGGISLLPYMASDDAAEILPYITNDILFSHLDIYGSRVTANHILENGVSVSQLQNLFSVVINGHIHAYQKLADNVYNIGASSSLSFSDDNNYTPSICVFDTESHRITRFDNLNVPRFIKCQLLTESDIAAFKDTYINKLTKYIVRCDTTHEFRSSVESMMNDASNIICYRIRTADNAPTTDEPIANIELNSDVDNEFDKFLRVTSELKFPLNDYMSVLSDLQEVKQ